ncbi:MAG: hypothetical protein ACFFCI_14365 [Promethearchaeota archaeon]
MAKTKKIIIKQDAFIRMITHVLRFGNEALEESVEVMGVCIGKKEQSENEIELLNVVPIQHGMQVSTGFSKEDIEFFAQLDKSYQEKDMKIIGWYISRPGWGLDFTEINMQNHRFFQTEKNPHGFLIILDHTLMEEERDFGLKIYILKDHKKSNEYQEVPYEIEIPASLSYFKWVQKFVEDSQRETPIMIKELKEAPLNGLQEIPLSEEDIIEKNVRDYSAQVNQTISGFRDGMSQINNIISETYESQLNAWIGDMTEGTLKGMEYIRGSLNQLKNTVYEGLNDVKNFFNSTFTEISSLFKKDITEYINKRIEGQKELKGEIAAIIEKMISDSIEHIESQIKNRITPLEESIEKSLTTLENLTASNSNLAKKTLELNENTSDMENDIENLRRNIKENVKKTAAPFNLQVNDRFEDINSELNPLKENYIEIQNLIEKLQKIITDFRNLT